jgi:hypothetical protein
VVTATRKGIHDLRNVDETTFMEHSVSSNTDLGEGL